MSANTLAAQVRSPQTRRGFTLVELLVVITIIVVLLALLAPAMDRAIYQAELAICGTRLHGIGIGALAYTIQNRRSYPDRPGVEKGDYQPTQIAYRNASTNFDWRPTLRPYIPINDSLQCPLTGKVDLETGVTDSHLFSPYNLWFGFQYLPNGRSEKGMKKLGDRWTWTEADGTVNRFSVLADDMDAIKEAPSPSNVFASHPDDQAVMWDWVLQDNDNSGVPEGLDPAAAAGNLRMTVSRWVSRTTFQRGLIDRGVLVEDGSVARYPSVKVKDPRMVAVGSFVSGASTGWYLYVPRN